MLTGFDGRASQTRPCQPRIMQVLPACSHSFPVTAFYGYKQLGCEPGRGLAAFRSMLCMTTSGRAVYLVGALSRC